MEQPVFFNASKAGRETIAIVVKLRKVGFDERLVGGINEYQGEG